MEERASGDCWPSPDFLSLAPSEATAQSRWIAVEGMDEKRKKSKSPKIKMLALFLVKGWVEFYYHRDLEN